MVGEHQLRVVRLGQQIDVDRLAYNLVPSSVTQRNTPLWLLAHAALSVRKVDRRGDKGQLGRHLLGFTDAPTVYADYASVSIPMEGKAWSQTLNS